jgi:hypothetical protein
MALDAFHRRTAIADFCETFAAILSFFKPYPRKEKGGGLKSPFSFLGEI